MYARLPGALCRRLGAAGLLLAIASPVLAQPEEDPRATARLRLGPFYVTPTLTIGNVGVDTNVFNQAGEGKQDFTAAVRPGAEAWLLFARRAALRTSGSLGLVYFHTYASERSVDPDLSMRPEIYLHRVTLFAEGRLYATRERPNFEIDARSRRTGRGALVGADVRVFRRLVVRLTAAEQQTRFDADAVFFGTHLRDVLDRNERSAALALRYRWSPLTTFVASGEAETHRFLHSPERNADSARFVGGVELRPRALVSGTAFLGVRRFIGLSDLLPDFQGVVASVGVGCTLLGATRVGFSADRDVSYSFERQQPYFVREGYGLTVRQALGRRFDILVGLQRATYTYRDLVASGLVRPRRPRVDVIRNLDLSLGFRPRADVRVGIGGAYWERVSETALFRNYNGLRLGLSASYGF
ncbi:MAG TPA: outer membrane beta-barrel protein [Vicinamibacterales bacterium]|nr:outer membrane beta-barrel protein [Vicinamibacterales bacterium]